MHKNRALAVVILFLVSLVATPAFAFETPTPNTPCATVDDFGIANGLMMTCKAVNSKQIWVVNKNVIAGGLCSSWVPGDSRTWAELQLFLKGKWITQVYPIAFTPGPTCDNTKINSSIPWIALPNKVVDGTKFRWIKGTSGKDGHGGRAFGDGYPEPAFVYSAKAMQAKYLKVYSTITAPLEGPHLYALKKNLSSSDTTKTTDTASTTVPIPSPTSPSTSSAQAPMIYVAKDQANIHHFAATEGCSNPLTTSVQLQVLVSGAWIPVHSVKSGWIENFNSCSSPQLGKKNSMAVIDAYMDYGVTYRWYFIGEVNIFHHDNLGNGYSESTTLPLPKPVFSPHPVVRNSGLTWGNIASRVKDISAVAYLDAQATIARNLGLPSAADNLVTYASSGAQQLDSNISEATDLMKRVFTLYANYPSAKNVFFIASTQTEKDQTYTKLDSLYPASRFMQESYDNMYGIKPNEPVGSVFTSSQCAGNDSLRNTVTWPKVSDAAAVIASYCPTTNPRVVLEAHHGVAHEYSHTIQIQIFDGKLGDFQPCWMTEGEAEWSQIAVSHDFSTYIDLQHLHPYYLTAFGLEYSVPSQTTWTASEIESYFQNANNISTCRLTPTYALAYSAGTAAIEALVALGGSESFFSLDQRLANNENFENAFNEVYGVTWAYAEPILADVVAQKLTHANQPDASTYQTRP